MNLRKTILLFISIIFFANICNSEENKPKTIITDITNLENDITELRLEILIINDGDTWNLYERIKSCAIKATLKGNREFFTDTDKSTEAMKWLYSGFTNKNLTLNTEMTNVEQKSFMIWTSYQVTLVFSSSKEYVPSYDIQKLSENAEGNYMEKILGAIIYDPNYTVENQNETVNFDEDKIKLSWIDQSLSVLTILEDNWGHEEDYCAYYKTKSDSSLIRFLDMLNYAGYFRYIKKYNISYYTDSDGIEGFVWLFQKP